MPDSQGPDPENRVERTPDEVSILVEMWKATVEVQQHFNDLEWKIRGLALTVLTGALGLGALALREGSTVLIGDWRFSLASLVLVAALLVWLAFYFVDSVWYHRLLVGAVKEGVRLEGVIQEAVPGSGELTTAIGAASPWSVPSQDVRKDRKGATRPTKKPWITLHSKHKLMAFYVGVGTVLFALAIAAHIAAGSVVQETTGTSIPDTSTSTSTTPATSAATTPTSTSTSTSTPATAPPRSTSTLGPSGP